MEYVSRLLRFCLLGTFRAAWFGFNLAWANASIFWFLHLSPGHSGLVCYSLLGGLYYPLLSTESNRRARALETGGGKASICLLNPQLVCLALVHNPGYGMVFSIRILVS